MISFPIMILRLVLALILGGAIGLERESSEHRAGIRTNALVSLGSSLFTIISAYGFLDLLTLNHVQLDPTRVASYIVAGIGFLGAGAIVVRQTGTRGLTTAAAIWTVAAIGMACGIGFYWEAVIATVLALIILRVLYFAEERLITEQSRAVLQVSLEPGRATGALMEQVYDICVGQRLIVQSAHVKHSDDSNIIEVKSHISNVTAALRVLDQVRELEGVRGADLDLQELEGWDRKRRR